RRAFPPVVGPARRLPEELLVHCRRAVGRVLDTGAGDAAAAAMARAGDRRRARVRRRGRAAADGGRRPFLQRRGLRRRVSLLADLAGARMALPLAPHAAVGRRGGARNRTAARPTEVGGGRGNARLLPPLPACYPLS